MAASDTNSVLSVEDAIRSRFSCRAFMVKLVPDVVVRSIFDAAKHAPSNGNIQPWRVIVLTDSAKQTLIDAVQKKISCGVLTEGEEQPTYPKDMKEPYFSLRRENGKQLYDSINIPISDKVSKISQFSNNWRFFGAPVGVIITIDRSFGPRQWIDLGCFINNICLLAKQNNLDTCVQASWASFPKTVSEVLSLPAHMTVACGMSLGYANMDHPINNFDTPRSDDFISYKSEI